MLHRRTFALALRACALSMLPALRHLWLQWSAAPTLVAWALPSCDLFQSARFVREDHEGSV